MPNNVVELIVKTLDEATPGLKAITGTLDTLRRGAEAFAVFEVFKTFIENSIEAETAMVRLKSAVEHSAEASYQSASQLAAFAEETARTSTFSKVAIEGAETALLRFGRLTGETFQRARADALDLAAGMGVDLETAARMMGRALESPTQGLRMLRQASIVFSPAQRALITDLEKTGQVAQAQEIIFKAVEARYKGMSDTIANTLGGALKRLGNAFDEAFKIDKISIFTKAVNALADGINNIKPAVEKATQSDSWKAFVTGGIPGVLGRAVGGLYGTIKGITPDATAGAGFIPGGRDRAGTPGAFVSQAELDQQAADRRARLLASLEEFKPGGGAGATAGLTTDQLNAQVAASEAAMKKLTDAIDVQHTSVGKTKDAMKDLYDTWDKETQTTVDKTVAAYTDVETKANELLKAGKISPKEYSDRINEAIDKALEFHSVLDKDGKEIGQVFDTAAIGLKRMVVPLTETQIAVHNFVSDFASAFANLAINGGLSMRNLLRDLVRMLADRAIFRAIDAIGTALEKALTPKGGAGGGWLGSIVSVIGALYGRAGGGDFSGLTVVGEEGPELVAGRGTVMNKRQLQFALGNAASTQQAVHYAPQTNITVQGNADEKTLQYLELRLQQSQKDQRNWLANTLYQNGYKRLR